MKTMFLLLHCVKGLLLLTAVADASFSREPRQNRSTVSSNCTAIRDAFQNVTIVPPTGNPYLGHQNLTYCCEKAVLYFFDHNCANTVDVRVFGMTESSQWPCGATWAHDPAGAPVVEGRWEWISAICPGWQLSAADNITQWAQLLIGFILPAAIFSLNVPRRRKIKIWDQLFPENISWWRISLALLGAITAMFIVVVDNIVWLLTIFAAAAPCLISGIYEGWLDKKVLTYLDAKHEANSLPMALKARMLFTILTGNLDLYPAWSDTMLLASSLDELDESDSARRQLEHTRASGTTPSENARVEPTSDTQVLDGPNADHDHEEVNGVTIRFADQVAHETNLVTFVQAEAAEETPSELLVNARRRKIVGKVSSRLSAMLACQYGFGCTIGGPVLYYVGAFTYALVDIRQSLGERDLSHALEFGLFLMVIPHVAICAGWLLAGNNPNTLEGIVGAKESHYFVSGDELAPTRSRRQSTFHEFRQDQSLPKSYPQVLERVYQAAYIPASMWNRGQCMQKWFLILSVNSLLKYKDSDDSHYDMENKVREFLHTTAMFDLSAWLILCSAALSLILIPCFLAFFLAYFTPQVGLSCRSFTLTMYMSAQTLLLILWTVRMTWGDKYWRQARLMKNLMDSSDHETELWKTIRKLAEMANTDTTSALERRIGPFNMSRRDTLDAESGRKLYVEHEWHPAVEWLYHGLLLLGFAVSVFSAVGGVLMELMGVFRSEFCNLNINRWLPDQRRGSWAMLSSNSALAIRLARKTWTAIGALSLFFLISSCYVGWWYQRRLRKHFKAVADRLNPQAPRNSEDFVDT